MKLTKFSKLIHCSTFFNYVVSYSYLILLKYPYKPRVCNEMNINQSGTYSASVKSETSKHHGHELT